MFFISLAANASCDEQVVALQKTTDTISAIQFNDCDILYSRNASSIVQNMERQDSYSLNNKGSYGSSDSSLNKENHAFLSQFEELLSYIHSRSYLVNKTKISFLIALSEVNPNAP